MNEFIHNLFTVEWKPHNPKTVIAEKKENKPRGKATFTEILSEKLPQIIYQKILQNPVQTGLVSEIVKQTTHPNLAAQSLSIPPRYVFLQMIMLMTTDYFSFTS